MSEPIASMTAVTVSSPTLTRSARNSLRTKSARSVALVSRAHGCTSAPSFVSLSANALARPPPEWTTTSSVPGGRSAAADSMTPTASLPASAADSSTTTRSSANNDGLNSSASSLTLTSPARRRSTGTSAVPAAARACRSTVPMARSTSSSSSPRIRCSPVTVSVAGLTARWCHAGATPPNATSRQSQPPRSPRSRPRAHPTEPAPPQRACRRRSAPR